MNIKMSFTNVAKLSCLQVTLADDTTQPVVEFEDPTPDDNAFQTQSYVNINVSIEEENLDEVVYNWDETNFTYYDDSLLLMMNFDDYTRLNDTSKYGNNGTIGGETTWTASGKYGGGYVFDGVDDWINFGQILPTDETKPFTMEAWVKPNTNPSWKTIIGTENTWAEITLTGSTTYFGQNGGGGWWMNGGTITLETWNHIVGVYNGSHGSIYVNGILKDGPTAHVWSLGNHGVTVMGRYSLSTGEWYNGTIDEARIWNRSLTSDEVYQQYISNLNKFNLTQWYLTVNQSKNATLGLDDGIYTYQAFAQDKGNLQSASEQRTIYINVEPSPPVPELSTLILMGTGLLLLSVYVGYRKKEHI